MKEDRNNADVGLDWRSVAIKAVLILLPLIGGYFLISGIQSKKPEPVGLVNPPARSYSFDDLSRVYPGMTAGEIDDLLTESWSRRLAYETFTQFREHSRTGKYVNIDRNGFRLIKNQGPWPPASSNFNIFVFGGSLTFGYAVADEDSVPSFLQEFLLKELDYDVHVYNFGRGHFYSNQERVLFEMMLVKGIIPDMAIFIDGANDFQYANDEALFTKQFEYLTTRMLSPDRANGDQRAAGPDNYYVARRYVRNQKLIHAISNAFGVRSVFVWHPVSQYKYDLTYHLIAREGYADTRWIPSAYRYMAAFVKDHPMGGDFIWCADIQEGLKEPLYVDRFHYTARLASLVADCIGTEMLDRGLIDRTRPRATP